MNMCGFTHKDAKWRLLKRENGRVEVALGVISDGGDAHRRPIAKG